MATVLNAILSRNSCSSTTHRHRGFSGAHQSLFADRQMLLPFSLILSVLSIGNVHAGPVTLTGISGVFSNPDLIGYLTEPFGPPTFFDNTSTADPSLELGDAKILWGNMSPGTSFLLFTPILPDAPVANEEEFKLGTVTFSNGIIDFDKLIFGADLTFSFDASAGGPVKNLHFQADIEQTRNGFGREFDADFVRIPIKGKLPVSLHAYEGESPVVAFLIGKIVGDPEIELTRMELAPGQEANGFIGNGTAPAAVPEPSSLALFGLSGVALGFARRRTTCR